LLHPGAWWLWAGGLAAAAMQTTNPLLLAGIVAVVAFVVAARRQPTPWSRSFGGFFKLALVLVAFRVVMQLIFGLRIDGTVLFTLPSVQLPDFMAGVVIGGPVTVELLVDALYTSMRLATVLICFGAVNALCSPYRLLRTMPTALYEAGVVVTVSLSFAPQLVVAVGRVRDARRLRGRPTAGLKGIRGMALPVLEDALERSVTLAASMDARGYGRRGDLSRRSSSIAAVATVVGLMALCVGVYALLDVAAPPVLRLPMLAVGSAFVAVALVARGRHSRRTRYEPDPWAIPEWVIAGTGVAVVAAFVATARLDPVGLAPSVYPLVWPTVPIVATLGIASTALAAWVAPVSPSVLGRAAVDDDPFGFDDAVDARARPGRVDPVPSVSSSTSSPRPAPASVSSASASPPPARSRPAARSVDRGPAVRSGADGDVAVAGRRSAREARP
jgi:energy-coupling factor transport system permease protein